MDPSGPKLIHLQSMDENIGFRDPDVLEMPKKSKSTLQSLLEGKSGKKTQNTQPTNADDSEYFDFNEQEKILLFLALCHSIIIDKRTNKMNSASPDELALVEGAQQMGLSFEGKDGEGMISIKRRRDDRILRYRLLNTLEFDSTRKRMSVILEDQQTMKIKLLCKGADSIIKERLSVITQTSKDYLETTQEYVDDYAKEGLRTLFLAEKPLKRSYYEDWNERFQNALTLVKGKDKKVDALQEEIETKLDLLGATAIEDKL